jgi:methylenetetrahydrofolate--tRNA-(uracil-5-)-methyltransferase
MSKYVNIIGGGLAGSEAALQLSKRGIKVKLYEMRPHKTTGAHVTADFAEFVCSNSLGSFDCTNASGLLKKEMEILGGELIKIAYECSVPAGGALAIDRNLFSQTVSSKIRNDENIIVINEEVKSIPE